jgi:hypothetical protein
MRLADYLALGGHMDHVRSLEDTLRHGAWHNEGGRSFARFPLITGAANVNHGHGQQHSRNAELGNAHQLKYPSMPAA